MATYVISDIHGCFDTFNQMIKTIGFSEKDKLVLAGDYVDRGSQSLEMLQWLKNHPANVVPIKGNHDAEFVEYIRLMEQVDKKNELMTDTDSKEDTQLLFDTVRYVFKQKNPLGLLYFDYYNTLNDLVTKQGATMGELKRWADMIEKWPYYMRFKANGRDVVVVHAGFCENTSLLKERHKSFGEFCLYAREEGLAVGGIKNGMVIAGHTPTIDADSGFYNEGRVFRYHDQEKDCIFYDIDCGCAYYEDYPSARMACLRIDDEEIFYS